MIEDIPVDYLDYGLSPEYFYADRDYLLLELLKICAEEWNTGKPNVAYYWGFATGRLGESLSAGGIAINQAYWERAVQGKDLDTFKMGVADGEASLKDHPLQPPN